MAGGARAGGLSHVSVVVEVAGDRLLVRHKEPKMGVDLFVYAIDPQGQTRDYFHQPPNVGLRVAEANLARNEVLLGAGRRRGWSPRTAESS